MMKDADFLRSIVLPDDLDGAKRLRAIAARLDAAEKELKRIEGDDRYHYKRANIFINAPLALIQCSMDAQVHVLKNILGRE